MPSVQFDTNEEITNVSLVTMPGMHPLNPSVEHLTMYGSELATPVPSLSTKFSHHAFVGNGASVEAQRAVGACTEVMGANGGASVLSGTSSNNEMGCWARVFWITKHKADTAKTRRIWWGFMR